MTQSLNKSPSNPRCLTLINQVGSNVAQCRRGGPRHPATRARLFIQLQNVNRRPFLPATIDPSLRLRVLLKDPKCRQRRRAVAEILPWSESADRRERKEKGTRANKTFAEAAQGARPQETRPDPSNQPAGGGQRGKTRHGPITIRLSETVHLPCKALKPPFRKVNVTMSKHQKIRCGVFNCGRKSN